MGFYGDLLKFRGMFEIKITNHTQKRSVKRKREI